MLEDVGFEPLEAGGADQATELLAEHLLFTDVDMPGSMNGFGLARETARLDPNIGILVASGRRNPGPADMPDGAVFIGKPFSAEVVFGRVKDVLSEQQRPEALTCSLKRSARRLGRLVIIVGRFAFQNFSVKGGERVLEQPPFVPAALRVSHGRELF